MIIYHGNKKDRVLRFTVDIMSKIVSMIVYYIMFNYFMAIDSKEEIVVQEADNI